MIKHHLALTLALTATLAASSHTALTPTLTPASIADGNVSVSAGLQGLDARYVAPLYRQYYGLSLDGSMQWSPTTIEVYPAGAPVVWTAPDNNIATARYQWSYMSLGPDGSRLWLTDDTDVLAATFSPDYTSIAECGVSLYAMPTLTVTAPGLTAATYSAPSDSLQAGGAPVYGCADGPGYGLLPFDINSEGLGIYTVQSPVEGERPVPVFGYSNTHDQWWHDYTYAIGADPDALAYVTGYMNWVHVSPSCPLVVRGASAAAIGKISADAALRLEVRTLDADGEIHPTPIAVAHVSGADAITRDYGDGLDYITLNFVFDSPLVLDGTLSEFGYLFEVTGYHDGGVEYFAPLQSIKPNPEEWCLGFYRHHRLYFGKEEDSYSYCAFFRNEYGDMYTTFAISLDAWYPWLDTVDGNVVTLADGRAERALGSYYSGEQYTVDTPDWLTVSLSGRYDGTRITFEADAPSPTDRTGRVTISAPGVEQTFVVNAPAGAGVSSAVIDRPTTADLYNTQGMLMRRDASEADLRNLPAGVYIHGNKRILVK